MLTFPLLMESSFVENFTDDFNRTDSATVGAGWTEVGFGWEIESNRIQENSLGTWELACFRDGTSWANGYVELTPATTVSATGAYIGPALRLASTTGYGAGYMAANDSSQNKLILYRWGTGQWEEIAGVTEALATLPIRIEANGSSLTVYTDSGAGWVQRISTSDSRWGSAGHPGITIATNVAGTYAGDDFAEGY